MHLASFQQFSWMMMHLEPESASNFNISEVTSEYIVVASQKHPIPLAISSSEIVDLKISKLSELSPEKLKMIMKIQPEIVIFGTGEQQIWPNKTLHIMLLESKIGFEFMSNAAAARTFNLLSSEGRNVLCLLMA